MQKEYVIYKTAEGDFVAHAESYEAKEGEREVARIEANSVAQAEKKFAKQQRKSGDEEEEGDVVEADSYSMVSARKKLTLEEQEELAAEEAEKLREEEEAKEDFEVMADAQGNPYIAGEAGDPKKAKATKKKPEPPELEESSLGVFRAKDAKEALAKATGTYKDVAEGMPRGAQTP
jgi:hypothetical protein